MRKFERHRLASKLSEEDDKHQVNTSMYLLGDEADDIQSYFQLTNEQSANYKTVKTKFDSCFAVKEKVIYEQALFNKRLQLANEPVDGFILSLYLISRALQLGGEANHSVLFSSGLSGQNIIRTFTNEPRAEAAQCCKKSKKFGACKETAQHYRKY